MRKETDTESTLHAALSFSIPKTSPSPPSPPLPPLPSPSPSPHTTIKPSLLWHKAPQQSNAFLHKMPRSPHPHLPRLPPSPHPTPLFKKRKIIWETGTTRAEVSTTRRYDKSGGKTKRPLSLFRFARPPSTPSSAARQEVEENDTFCPTLIELQHGMAVLGAVLSLHPLSAS